MKKPIKIIDFDYLNHYKSLETMFNIPQNYVVVDRRDWEEVVNYFKENPEEVNLLGENNNTLITIKNEF